VGNLPPMPSVFPDYPAPVAHTHGLIEVRRLDEVRGTDSGLGLSITHDIVVKQHGGRIDVETEPGAFTDFIITLPRGNGNIDRPKSE
jgi:signal transduction histidine kinase